jgi:hypothetical protein
MPTIVNDKKQMSPRSKIVKGSAKPKLPASKKDVRELFDWIDEKLAGADCDCTLRHTRDFIRMRGLDEAGVVEWLKDHGGYCDCEVLINVE